MEIEIDDILAPHKRGSHLHIHKYHPTHNSPYHIVGDT